MVEPIHRSDSESIQDKLGTATLAFKSIAGNSANYFEKIHNRYSGTTEQLSNVLSIQQQLLVAISNYTQAVRLLIQLYQKLFIYGNGKTSWLSTAETTMSNAEKKWYQENPILSKEEFLRQFQEE